MTISFLSNSKVASKNISIFTPSETDNTTANNGVYIGRTSTYRIPFFLDTGELLNPHIAIIGMTGSGKTYFMKSYLIRSRLQNGTDIFILDWNGEYTEVVSFLNGTVITLENNSMPEIDNLLGGICSINLTSIKDENARKQIANKLFDLILEHMHGMPIEDKKRRIFVVDEAWKTFDNDNKLGQLFREGRKYGFSVIISTQLARDVNNEILANSGTILVFRLQNSEDHSTLVDSGIVASGLKHTLSELGIGSCIMRLAYKGGEARYTNIVVKKVDGISTSIYTFNSGKMQIKISNKEFFRITEVVIKDTETRAKLNSFIEANNRDLELGGLIRFLIKNGLSRRDIVTYVRLLGFDDLTIVKSYESIKKAIIVTRVDT
jgi:hypothetical protein